MAAFHEEETLSRKTGTRTIRIDEEVNKLLEELATKNNASVNFVINKSLRKYVEWDAYAADFGFSSIPLSLLVRLVDDVSEKKLREVGRWAGSNMQKELIAFWFKEVSVKNALESFRIISEHSGLFQFEHTRAGSKHVLILKHELGGKWSAFFEEALKATFQLFDIQLKAESTENQVVAEFGAPGLPH